MMNKKTLCILFNLFLPCVAMAGTDSVQENNPASCASEYFYKKIADNFKSQGITKESDEYTVQDAIYASFYDGDTLQSIIDNCEGFDNPNNETTIRFPPIQYKFPQEHENDQERVIEINYETQPKLLHQRRDLANKRTLPSSNTSEELLKNPSQRIAMDDPNDTTLWTNLDPAWYGIMVVEAGSMDDYVGPEKNNTIYVNYIAQPENIERFYPKGANCTSKTAIARDDKAINLAGQQTTDNTKNDFYVAGDRNLEWIAYAEITLEIALAVLTWGGSAYVSGSLKAAQAAADMKTITSSISKLRKSDDVRKYIKYSGQIKQLSKKPDRTRDIIRSMDYADGLADSGIKMTRKPGYISREKLKAADAGDYLKKNDITTKTGSDGSLKYFDKNGNELTQVDLDRDIPIQYTNTSGQSMTEDEVYNFLTKKNNKDNLIKNLEKQVTELEKTDKVKEYKNQSKAFSDLHKYRNELKGIKNTNRGNILRKFKTVAKAAKAARSGGDILKAGHKAARASTFAGRAKNWLFYATRRSGAALAKTVGDITALDTAIRIAGDMYDVTSDSSSEYTNNIDFKPLLLLSADDIEGYENVVNYGMWLMWLGSSTSPADDDAAYLQAMDFADHFHQNLMEVQNETNSPCNVDIYVVKPILRGADTDNPQLFYLIMNDEPWSTNTQR